MKTLLLTLITVLALNSYAQNVNIPDANFKAYLVGNASINTNGDAEIQVSEAVAFGGEIYCDGLNISDLTGIEAFTALTWLSCFDNQLSSLDVTQNTALVALHLGNNQLSSLDVTQNTALVSFECSNNQLTCLNVKNGNNTALFELEFAINPNLTCIEVDDVAYSTTNWTVANGSIDPQTSFSTSCANPCALGLNELSNTPKQLLKIVDLMGRETPYKPNTVLIYVFDDGSTEKVFKMEE